MARIPEAEIEQLKRGVPLAKLAEAHGVRLRRHGADLLGRCPFHADKTPSLVIAPEKNLWHCLGACQTGGSAIDWVMRADGVSFRHAVEKLRADFPSFAAVSPSPPPRLAPLVTPEAGDDELLASVVSHYETTLETSPEAQAYLDERKIGSAEARHVFRLGFSNRTLGYRMPEGESSQALAARARLQALGVFRTSGHEHLVGSVAFPPLDEDGRVVNLYGRKIGERLRTGTPAHLCLPGPRRGLWNPSALAESREIILCEAVIDALTFWSAGHRHVTTSYGVEGFTDEHWAAFRRHGTRVVKVAYDGDEAGDRAAVRLSKELRTMGISSLRVRFPDGMDANAYARAVHPGGRDLTWALERAEWLEKAHATVVVPETVGAPEGPETPDGSSLAAVSAVSAASVAAPVLGPVACPSPPADASPPPSPSSPPSGLTSGEGDELVARRDDRVWRIRGLAKNTSAETLRVQLRVTRAERSFVDTLELYSAKARGPFVKQASEELGAAEAVTALAC
jgi:DNA primase